MTNGQLLGILHEDLENLKRLAYSDDCAMAATLVVVHWLNQTEKSFPTYASQWGEANSAINGSEGIRKMWPLSGDRKMLDGHSTYKVEKVDNTSLKQVHGGKND